MGQRLLHEAIRLDPSLVDDRRQQLLEALVRHSIADENLDHETLLKKICAQLPSECAWMAEQYPWAAARGWLWRGTRALLWLGADAGRRHLTRAAALGASIDERFVQGLTSELLSYEVEYGAAAADAVHRALLPFLAQVGGGRAVRRLNGCYAINRAFASYREQRYGPVPARVVRAIANDPRYLFNRGVLAILLRSIARQGHDSSGADTIGSDHPRQS